MRAAIEVRENTTEAISEVGDYVDGEDEIEAARRRRVLQNRRSGIGSLQEVKHLDINASSGERYRFTIRLAPRFA